MLSGSFSGSAIESKRMTGTDVCANAAVVKSATDKASQVNFMVSPKGRSVGSRVLRRETGHDAQKAHRRQYMPRDRTGFMRSFGRSAGTRPLRREPGP